MAPVGVNYNGCTVVDSVDDIDRRLEHRVDGGSDRDDWSGGGRDSLTDR